MYSFAEHTGELEIRLQARSLPSLFEEAARALAEVMSDRPLTATGDYQKVVLHARDREALLVAWLDELIFLCERDKRVFAEVRVERLSDGELVASVRGAAPEALQAQAKAATFHGLHILDGDGGVSATVILDV